jgi:hypothetical protein
MVQKGSTHIRIKLDTYNELENLKEVNHLYSLDAVLKMLIFEHKTNAASDVFGSDKGGKINLIDFMKKTAEWGAWATKALEDDGFRVQIQNTTVEAIENTEENKPKVSQ